MFTMKKTLLLIQLLKVHYVESNLLDDITEQLHRTLLFDVGMKTRTCTECEHIKTFFVYKIQ